MRRVLAAIGAVLVLGAPPAVAQARAPQRTTRLACGDAAFVLRATPAGVADLNGPVAQSLTAHRRGAVRRVRLDMDGQPRQADAEEDRLAAFVGGLTCLTAPDGRSYVQVEYVCNALSPVSPPVCSGRREWFRYLDPAGAPVDRGYAPQDRRYPALLRRLGIDRPLTTTAAPVPRPTAG